MLRGRKKVATEAVKAMVQVMARSRGVQSSAASHSPTTTTNWPLTGDQMHRAGGIASFMRLPIHKDTQGLDACFVGVPLDSGTSNRSGTRMGPRQIRCESVSLRPYNPSLRASPFTSLNVADLGDIAANPYDLQEACNNIRDGYQELIQGDCIPLTMGGDHTISYPILQAIKARHGRVCLLHIDAHGDVTDSYMGSKITHGSPFYRALEEDLIDPSHTVQVGLRGSCHTPHVYDWQIKKGFQVVSAEECWHKSLTPLMKQIRNKLGDKPVYLSFDIDAIDPGYCPGTGTLEIGGLTPIQALEIVRGCRGLNLVGCDMVEVSPPYDFVGTTAVMASHLLFEMLCALPGVKAG